MMLATVDAARAERGARALRLRARRGGRGRRGPLDRRARSPAGLRGDFAITGEPTDLHIGVQAKGVLAVRASRSPASPRTARRRGWATTRSSRPTTPSGGSRRCPSAASPPTSSTARRSTSRGSSAATRSTRCPTRCCMDVDIRYLPNQDTGAILAQIREIADLKVVKSLRARPGDRLAAEPVRACPARRAGPVDRGRSAEHRPRRRLRRGLVHRGRRARCRVRPDRRRPPRPRRVGLDRSLSHYRRALGDFVAQLPAWLEEERGGGGLRALEGGLA